VVDDTVAPLLLGLHQRFISGIEAIVKVLTDARIHRAEADRERREGDASSPARSSGRRGDRHETGTEKRRLLVGLHVLMIPHLAFPPASDRHDAPTVEIGQSNRI